MVEFDLTRLDLADLEPGLIAHLMAVGEPLHVERKRDGIADITEQHTGEDKLYVCAIKDAYSNRIIGYSIDTG